MFFVCRLCSEKRSQELLVVLVDVNKVSAATAAQPQEEAALRDN